MPRENEFFFFQVILYKFCLYVSLSLIKITEVLKAMKIIHKKEIMLGKPKISNSVFKIVPIGKVSELNMPFEK